MRPPVYRFAPSPNGYLHVGHARSALLNLEMARAHQGRLLLRIEDIDTARCRPAFETAIVEDLGWLGLEWEQPIRLQSQHFEAYRAALARLDRLGIVYATGESRATLARQVAEFEAGGARWPRDPDGAPVYPGPAGPPRRAEPDGLSVLRLDVRRAFQLLAAPLSWDESGHGPADQTGMIRAAPEIWGDVVLARRDSPTSYHLAVVIDDAEQGVTDIVRGQDLFWATGIHRLLQDLLGLPAPRYHHHTLVLDRDGRKLSKSAGSPTLRSMRANGATVRDIRVAAGLG
jgi:glutamyl-Q tRNA(Asp) synthetase